MPFVKIDLWKVHIPFTFVQVYGGQVWKGRDKGTKNKLIKAVQVVISEVEKENWGLGGVPASEKFPDK